MHHLCGGVFNCLWGLSLRRLWVFVAMLMFLTNAAIAAAGKEKAMNHQGIQLSVKVMERVLRPDVPHPPTPIKDFNGNYATAWVTLLLTVRNKSSQTLFIPDPNRHTGALTLHLWFPSGEERKISSPPLSSGMPPHKANAQLGPGKSETFEIDLGSLFPIEGAGTYKLVVEYPWSQAERWRSPELTFTR